MQFVHCSILSEQTVAKKAAKDNPAMDNDFSDIIDV